jgi:hypothetical protein
MENGLASSRERCKFQRSDLCPNHHAQCWRMRNLQQRTIAVPNKATTYTPSNFVLLRIYRHSTASCAFDTRNTTAARIICIFVWRSYHLHNPARQSHVQHLCYWTSWPTIKQSLLLPCLIVLKLAPKFWIWRNLISEITNKIYRLDVTHLVFRHHHTNVFQLYHTLPFHC